MGCHNMPVREWTPEQLEKGVLQIHVQQLRVKNGKIRHGPSVTIHTTDKMGLFDDASKALVEIGVQR